MCSHGVHAYDAACGLITKNDSKCVNCHRCVCACPTGALKIVESNDAYRANANWSRSTIDEIYRQAESGGVLLSSMGNPETYPEFWNRLLINASQVTNPSIDPLREPMETKLRLGCRNVEIVRDETGRLKDTLPPQLELEVPVMFSAMSYGSVSYNVHAALANAAESTAKIQSSKSRRADSACSAAVSTPPRQSKSRWGRAQNPASADTCRRQR